MNDLMENELKSQILAVLYAAGRPVSLDEFKHLGQDQEAVLRILTSLEAGLQQDPSQGVLLERVAGGWRLVVHPAHLKAVELVLRPSLPRLSRAAVEVLAIVAYHQPVTRAEMESLRGRGVEGVLDGLLERELVKVTGEKDTVGRPKLYGTTQRFLEIFGLDGLNDLPPVGEGPVLLLRD